MVLGAGRGPLVTASLQAADKAERQIKVYAVEKNPNAIVTYVLCGNDVSCLTLDIFKNVISVSNLIYSDCNISYGTGPLQ